MEQVRSWYVSGRQCWLGFLEPLWSLATVLEGHHSQ